LSPLGSKVLEVAAMPICCGVCAVMLMRSGSIGWITAAK
jgi:hypothetical protein